MTQHQLLFKKRLLITPDNRAGKFVPVTKGIEPSQSVMEDIEEYLNAKSEGLDCSDVLRPVPVWAFRYIHSKNEQRADEKNRILEINLEKEMRRIAIENRQETNSTEFVFFFLLFFDFIFFFSREVKKIEEEKRRFFKVEKMALQRTISHLEAKLSLQNKTKLLQLEVGKF